jgi:hypothetical protein
MSPAKAGLDSLETSADKEEIACADAIVEAFNKSVADADAESKKAAGVFKKALEQQARNTKHSDKPKRRECYDGEANALELGNRVNEAESIKEVRTAMYEWQLAARRAAVLRRTNLDGGVGTRALGAMSQADADKEVEDLHGKIDSELFEHLTEMDTEAARKIENAAARDARREEKQAEDQAQFDVEWQAEQQAIQDKDRAFLDTFTHIRSARSPYGTICFRGYDNRPHDQQGEGVTLPLELLNEHLFGTDEGMRFKATVLKNTGRCTKILAGASGEDMTCLNGVSGNPRGSSALTEPPTVPYQQGCDDTCARTAMIIAMDLAGRGDLAKVLSKLPKLAVNEAKKWANEAGIKVQGMHFWYGDHEKDSNHKKGMEWLFNNHQAFADYPIAVTLSNKSGRKKHAVVAFKGICYDPNNKFAVEFTKANLGDEYVGITEGYRFVTTMKSLKRKRMPDGLITA